MTIELPEERRLRLEVTPLARAIGFDLTHCSGGRAEASLPSSDLIRVSAENPATHPSALMAFLDHLSGYAVASREPGHVGISTVELQVAFTGLPAIGPLRGSAECVSPVQASTLVLGRIEDAAGKIIATSSSWFTVGAFPGGHRDSSGHEEPMVDLGPVSGPYENLIGLAPDGEGGASLAAGVIPAIGWIGLPALHGGAIGAVMAKACEQRLLALGRPGFRLATMTIRYLRAAKADGLHAVATCDWPGRRAAHLAARCFPADGPDSAQAQAFFVPATD